MKNPYFNEDTTCLNVGNDHGFVLYKLHPTLEKQYVTELNGGIGLVRQLNKTSILGLCGGGTEPYRAKDTAVIWNDHKKETIFEIDMHEPIKNLYVTNKCVIVVLEKRVYISSFDQGDFKKLKDTYCNENGICKYINDNDNDNLVIAMLGSKKGEIAIWNIKSINSNKEKYKTIQAHENNISAIALNSDGTLVATASESGTNIHVYSTESGKQQYKFRRGTNGATIYDLAFDRNSKYLVCCSNTGTVHIFDLYKSINETKNEFSSLSFMKSYVNYFDSQWSFKKISIGDKTKMICAFDNNSDIHIATWSGNYYRIPYKNGEFGKAIGKCLYIDQN